jgi:microcystin-dependent protein
MATAKLSRIVSDFETSLSGAISIGATSFTIQSATDLSGVELSDGLYCFTIDRDSTGNKEYLIGQLDASEKTITSISSVSRQGALTSNAQIAHRVGANVIISDHSILSTISRIFTGVDTIDPSAPLAYASAPTLSSATQIATKGYVDSVVTGGTVNSDRIILGSQTAGETVAEGEIVYFKSSDSRWWLADADLTATFTNVQLGIAQGAGTAGNSITGGVLIYGKSDNFTGLTATATYYLSNTAGAVASSAGTNTIVLGQAFATTGIFFNPDTIQASISQVPTGSITMYSSATPPSGWLNCDGSAVSRTTYANLFAVVSTTYGIGDNSTTFNLPDLKARFPLGYSASAPTKVFTFASRSSDTITVTSDVLTNSTTNELQTGQKVNFVSDGTTITGLTSGNDYYLIRVAYNQFKLATSVSNANRGTAITLSGDGTGNRTFTATYTARALGNKGGTETDTEVATHKHTTFVSSGATDEITGANVNASLSGATTSDAGSDTPSNMPLFTVVNYIIKT